MAPKRVLKIAARGLSRRKLRTALTSFAVFIGVFLIVLMVSASLGGKELILGQLTGQLDLTNIFVGREGSMMAFSGMNVDVSEKDKEIKKITPDVITQFESIENVSLVVPFTLLPQSSIELVNTNVKFNTVMGTGFDFATIPKYVKEYVAGEQRNLESGEIALGVNFAKSIDDYTNDELIGMKVIVRPDTNAIFSAKQKDTGIKYELTIASIVDVGQDSSTFFMSPVDAGEYVSTFGGFDNIDEYLNEIGYDQVIVNANEVENTQKVAEIIKSKGYEAITVDNLIEMFNNIFLIIQIVFSMFGVIALFVAAIGIANTMVMSVYERTKEIGIFKAVGATKSNIRNIFLAEAAMIGFIGGTSGLAIGYGLTKLGDFILIKQFFEKQDLDISTVFITPVWLALGVIVFAILIGMIAGLYPSNKAAKLDPIKALSFE